MAKGKKAYFGIPWILSLILAIIPFTSWILGAFTRLSRGHLISGLLQLFVIGEVIFWFVDMFTMLTAKDLTFFA